MADEGTEYRKRWARLNSLVEAGNSWSGNERNYFFLNRGDGKFVDVSGASGFDFSGDGRGLALCDWDDNNNLNI